MKTEEEKIARIAKALSDQTRVKILKEISQKGSISCGDAEKVVDLSQPTVSHHLKILNEADLLITEKNGRHIRMTVNKKTLKEFYSMVSNSIKI